MASKKSAILARNYFRIGQQTNARKEIVSLKKLKVICPGGFPYHDYDLNAKVTPWSILSMVDFSRNIAFSSFPPDCQSFLDVTKLSEQYLLFTAATTTNISPKLYDFSTTKGPVEFHIELDNVGKTSYSIKTRFFLEDQDAPVIENEAQMVMVDINLKRPSPPPEWWREKYATGLETGKGLRIPRNVVPDSGILSHYQVKISASNLDMYLHTNWANYLKFCYDAFVEYEIKKHGKENIHDAFREVKQFSLRFMQESSLMDVLDVQFWEDPENSNLYKFQIHNKAEDLCESQIEFYPYENTTITGKL